MFIEELLFDIADALLVPVLVLSVLALAAAVVEIGALIGELVRRRHRGPELLTSATERLRVELAAADDNGARATASMIAWSESMRRALVEIVSQRGREDAEANVAKALSDFEYRTLKKLERTRILVRFGPALGLMGTLIPLSPALAGLAEGDFETLDGEPARGVQRHGLGPPRRRDRIRRLARARPPLRPGLLGRRVRRDPTLPYIDTAPEARRGRSSARGSRSPTAEGLTAP